MITDPILDAVIEQVANNTVDLTGFYQGLAAKMPITASALLDADTRLLSEPEHDFMLYVGMIILLAIQEVSRIEDVTTEAIGLAEERRWELINDSGNNALQKIWDGVDEEAVLEDFVLDAVGPDEMPEFLTEAGTLIIYAKLMAIVDCLEPKS